MSKSNKHLSRFLADYGMSVVLLLLCVLFTFATLGDQTPTGERAAVLVAGELRSASRVVIVAGTGEENARFVAALAARMKADGKTVVEQTAGPPTDARAALQRCIERAASPDAIAASADAMAWPFIARLHEQFPSLANATLAFPHGSRWPTFLNRDNLLNIASQVVVIALLAVGMTMVIITGGIDLSVGSLIALSAVVCARCIRSWGGVDAGGGALVAAAAAGIGICAVLGATSGLLVTTLRLPAFIATLGVMQIASGTAKILSNGESIYDIPSAFTTLGRGASLVGIPNGVLLMVVTYVVAHAAMSRMTFGRYVYATGGGIEAARLSGVRVNVVRLAVYAISGLMAGLGGIVVTSQLKAGAPTYGVGYELKAIAAVVVGGTSLAGGSGKVFATLIGALIIAVIENGMNLAGITSNPQQVVLGAVLLAAVIFDTLRRRGRWIPRRSAH